MTSRLELWNMALSLAGSSATVADESENSPAAHECARWYSNIVRNVQSSAPWGACRAHSRLAQVAERDWANDWTVNDPSPSFSYAYQQPADLLIPYHLHSFQRFTWEQSIISTNEHTPILYYNRLQEQESAWEQPLFNAVLHMLASYLSESLGRNRQRKADNFEIANSMVENAQVRSANAGMEVWQSDPDWIQARNPGGASLGQQPQYYYPMKSLRMGFDS